MEFKYRAVNNKTTNTSSPLSATTSISEQIVPGAGESLRVSKACRLPMEMWRELEKEKIRWEIITSEIVRRHELEEEVRREMMMDRALGFPTEKCLVTPFSFQDRLASWSSPIMNPLPDNDIIDMSRPQLPEIVTYVEIKRSPQIDKDKVITLPKPNVDLHNAKRKAVTTGANDKEEASTFGLMKKSKEEWKCSLCQVSATSEKALNDHLNGKKHKAKRTHMVGNNSKKTSLSFQKNENCVKDSVTIPFPTILPGLDAKTSMQFPQPSMEEEKAMAEPRILEEGEIVEDKESQIKGTEENKDGKESEEAGKKGNALGKKNVTLWCEVCQICTFSPVVMETHNKGKKHLRQVMKLSGSNNNR